MRLSVCIVNWNTREDLRECLLALQANPFTSGEQEVIVVDNASADGSAAMVASEFPDARLIANPVNANFAHGTNQALAAATGDFLLLLNPDAQVTEGALNALVERIRAGASPAPTPFHDVSDSQHTITQSPNRSPQHPTPNTQHPLGAVAAKLVYPDGLVQTSVRGFPEPVAVLYDILGLSRLFPRSRTFAAYRATYFDYERAQAAPQPMASCFLISREAYEQVGGMDERFPLYFNDVDWCLRCRDAGLGIWYEPKAVVIHGGGGTTKKARKAVVWESHRALLRLYAKHYRKKTPFPLYALLTALVTLGAWARTGRWGKSLGKDGGETTPESLHTELEREKRSAGVSA